MTDVTQLSQDVFNVAVDPSIQVDVEARLPPISGTGGGGGGGSSGIINYKQVTSTTYTFVLGDLGYEVEFANASAITVTIPTNASVAFPVGAVIYPSQGLAGVVTIVGASGVTLKGVGGLSTAGQDTALTLHQISTNVWRVFNGV